MDKQTKDILYLALLAIILTCIAICLHGTNKQVEHNNYVLRETVRVLENQ